MNKSTVGSGVILHGVIGLGWGEGLGGYGVGADMIFLTQIQPNILCFACKIKTGSWNPTGFLSAQMPGYEIPWAIGIWNPVCWDLLGFTILPLELYFC